MRFGISTIDGILLKSFRTRRPHAILPAIHPPRPGRWGLRSTHPGGTWHPTQVPPKRRVGSRVDPDSRGPGLGQRERRLLHFHPAPDLLELLLDVRRLGLG